jgi:hypothetical protein
MPPPSLETLDEAIRGELRALYRLKADPNVPPAVLESTGTWHRKRLDAFLNARWKIHGVPVDG